MAEQKRKKEKVVKTRVNQPSVDGLYHHIPPIYGKLRDGL
jgi:hypothetical protein